MKCTSWEVNCGELQTLLFLTLLKVMVGKNTKTNFVRFLIFSHASCLETINHLEKLAHLYPQEKQILEHLYTEYDQLGGKIYNFIKYVEQNWKT